MAEPTLRQLRYLVALADERHFGNAAASCWVSQPNLSAQIRQLETAMGTDLVERGGRRVLLTPAGEEAVRRARLVLRDVDDLVEAARGAAGPLRGPLRLGVIPTVAPYLLPRVLPAVRATFPDLELHLSEDFTHRLLESLTAGELDAVLAALPLEGPGIEAVEIRHEPFVLVVPSDHPLAEAEAPPASVLDPAELLLLHEGHCLRDQALEVCGLERGRTRSMIEGTSLSTLVQMVAGGLGVTLLPLSAVPVDIPEKRRFPAAGRGEIRARHFAPPFPGRHLGLAWRATSGRRQDFAGLADLLRTETDTVLAEAETLLEASEQMPQRA